MLTNIVLPLIEGLGVVVSPCLLPMIPLILSSSVDSTKRRAIGVILGFVLCFTLFMFFSHTLIVLLGVDPGVIKVSSLILLAIVGLTMIIPTLGDRFSNLMSRLSTLGLRLSNNPKPGLLGGMAFGAILGLIWTPCAGPIFGAIMMQIMQQTSLQAFISLLMFSLGVGIPMLCIALGGQRVLGYVDKTQKYGHIIRICLGLIILSTCWYLI